MTDKHIAEAMAVLDGWEICSWNGMLFKGIFYAANIGLPDYLNDHNAVQLVVDGLSNEELCVFDETLNGVMGFKVISYLVWRATPRQKCEAILKAKGLWS